MRLLFCVLLVVAKVYCGRFALPDKATIEILGATDVQDTGLLCRSARVSLASVLSTSAVALLVCLEGFYFKDGFLYQSNGWWGESALVKIDPKVSAAAVVRVQCAHLYALLLVRCGLPARAACTAQRKSRPQRRTSKRTHAAAQTQKRRPD